MPIDKYKQTPSPASSKPTPPDAFTQTPPRDGSMPFGSGPDNAGKMSPGGVPSGVVKHSPTENMQSRKDKNGPSKSGGSKMNAIPAGVQTFRQTT